MYTKKEQKRFEKEEVRGRHKVAAMASKTKDFFESGNSAQFEWVLGLYDQCLRLKAESKSSKPDNVIKLDKW